MRKILSWDFISKAYTYVAFLTGALALQVSTPFGIGLMFLAVLVPIVPTDQTPKAFMRFLYCFTAIATVLQIFFAIRGFTALINGVLALLKAS